MAPVRTASQQSDKPLKSILKKSSTPNTAKPPTFFATSKKDKRRIKHAQLMSKVTKSSSSKPRRRRPSKKLVTTLDALADALPDDNDDDGKAVANSTSTTKTQIRDQVNVIERKSIKSRPGALKRKEKLDKSERDRFAKNMAQMSASTKAALPKSNASSDGTTSASSPAAQPHERWVALRSFISQTLEQKPELKSLAI